MVCTSATKRFFFHSPKMTSNDFSPWAAPCATRAHAQHPLSVSHSLAPGIYCCIFSQRCKKKEKKKKRLNDFFRVPFRTGRGGWNDIAAAHAGFDNRAFKCCGNRKQDCCPVLDLENVKIHLISHQNRVRRVLLLSCLPSKPVQSYFFPTKHNCKIQIVTMFW